MSLGLHWFHDLRIGSGNIARSDEWAGRRLLSSAKGCSQRRSAGESWTYVCSRPGDELGWEAGILLAYFKKPNKDGPFSRKPRGTSNLASSSSFVGFRLLASICVLCPRNDTRHDTRRERLPEFSP